MKVASLLTLKSLVFQDVNKVENFDFFIHTVLQNVNISNVTF